MAHHYAVDLGEALFGEPPMPVARLWALLRNLPRDSALALRAIAERDAMTPAPTPAPVAPAVSERVVTSLRGLNLHAMMSGSP